MEASYRELRQDPAEAACGYPPGAPHARHAVWRKLCGWPLQPDHTRIRESNFVRWLAPSFEAISRRWMGVYLGFEARRRD